MQRARRAPRALFLTVLGLLCLSGCGEAEEVPVRYPGELSILSASSIFIAHGQHPEGESLLLALRAMEELQQGASFAELARRTSDDQEAATRGGFMGFRQPFGSEPLDAAIQALPIGSFGGPVNTERGFHVLYRHSFEEGRRLEAQYVTPVYGFFLPYAQEPEQDQLSQAQAETRAREAWQRVHDGELSLQRAMDEYSPSPSRSGSPLIGNVWVPGPRQELYEAVKGVEPGELAPVLELPGAFAVLKRGRYFRSIVRHILIQHAESPNRPLHIVRSRAEAEALAKQALGEAAPDGANWGDVLRKYSDEPRLIPLGGTIGPVTNGDLIPELEDAILATPPGRVAGEVAESPDGYHVIWRAN